MLTIDNEFVVQLSGDGQNWTTVATETNQYHDGQNKADRTFDLTPYLGAGRAGYVRIADSFPNDGWGGRVTTAGNSERVAGGARPSAAAEAIHSSKSSGSSISGW